MKTKILFSIVLSTLLSTPTFASVPKKIILVMLENTNYSTAIKQPFMGDVLAKNGTLFTNFHAITHPSEPNYIALIAGTTFGLASDKTVKYDANHLGDLLEAQGKTWHVYAEDFPGKCFLGASRGKYARKHTPFVSFVNIQNNPERCANITDASSFASDFNSGRLANYNMYIPNLNDDGHDTGAAYADKWLAKTFGPLLSNTAAMKDVMLIVTFDEDGGSATNQIYTVFYGPGVNNGLQINTRYDHYSLLRTVEELMGVGNLGLEDEKANAMTGFLNYAVSEE